MPTSWSLNPVWKYAHLTHLQKSIQSKRWKTENVQRGDRQTDRWSHFCVLDTPLRKLAWILVYKNCPYVHHPILPARSASEGQLPPCLAPEAFFIIPLGLWTGWAGLFCHFGIRHHYCSSGSESIDVKLPFGLGKKNEIREKGQLSARGEWRKVQKIARKD